jgi:predicted DNA-binding ArsR family transcriptional regulator
MARIKVVNEPSDLVGLLTAVDSPVKRDVYLALTSGWESERTIESRFGLGALEALSQFDKQDLLDSRWETSAEGPKKMFHARYSSFKIDTTAPMVELTEVLSAAMMPGEEFRSREDALVAAAKPAGINLIDASARLSVSQTMLRALVKRSGKVEMRGLRILPTGNGK